MTDKLTNQDVINLDSGLNAVKNLSGICQVVFM